MKNRGSSKNNKTKNNCKSFIIRYLQGFVLVACKNIKTKYKTKTQGEV